MSDRRIIFWLLCFFPLGAYYMFKYTDWTKATKYGVTGIGTFLLGTIVAGGSFFELLLISGAVLILAGLTSLTVALIKKKNNHFSGLLLVYGLLFTFLAQGPLNKKEEIAEEERIAVEQRIEQEKLAEEKKQEEIARKEEEKQKQREERRREAENLRKAEKAVELAEKEPTQENYNKASDKLKALAKQNTELNMRLEQLQPIVAEYEESLENARIAVEEAEETQERSDYESAYLLASSLPVKNKLLTDRLESLDEDITKAEEEKAEEERIAAEKAEEERIAAEKAAAEKAAAEKAEAERVAAANAAAAKKSQSNAVASKPAGKTLPENDQSGQTVFVAPHSGKKYHLNRNCRGLNSAKSVKGLSISQAKNQGYTICGFEK